MRVTLLPRTAREQLHTYTATFRLCRVTSVVVVVAGEEVYFYRRSLPSPTSSHLDLRAPRNFPRSYNTPCLPLDVLPPLHPPRTRIRKSILTPRRVITEASRNARAVRRLRIAESSPHPLQSRGEEAGRRGSGTMEGQGVTGEARARPELPPGSFPPRAPNRSGGDALA